jgi:hypothetical protein
VRQRKASEEIAAGTLTLALFAVFLFIGYCLIYFVTVAFFATGNGLIKWGEGWNALKELFGL